MLEIVTSSSEKYLLEQTKMFNADDIFDFSLLLSCGKIKDLKTSLTRNIYNYDIDIQSNLKKLEQKILKYKNIRIWISSQDNEDVCTLCFIINYSLCKRDINFYICDVYNKEYYSLGSYSVNETPQLINRSKKLTIYEINYYKDLWEKLEKENGDLRIIENNTLVSYSYDYLDNKIIELLKKYDSIYYWEFTGICLSKRLCNFYGDIFFTYRINEMIKEGKIIISKREKSQNFMGEEIIKEYIKASSNC